MFIEMRRKDRALDNNDIAKILSDNAYGILATMGEDGYPYGVPISYVYSDNTLYVHGATQGHKLDNIFFANKVSFTIVGSTCVLPDKFSTNFESVIAFGKAVEVFDEEKLAVLLEFINKYSPNFIEQGKEYIDKASRTTRVIKIGIEHITGKRKDENKVIMNPRI